MRGPRRAAINNFGFGGIMHLLLENGFRLPTAQTHRDAVTRPAPTMISRSWAQSASWRWHENRFGTVSNDLPAIPARRQCVLEARCEVCLISLRPFPQRSQETQPSNSHFSVGPQHRRLIKGLPSTRRASLSDGCMPGDAIRSALAAADEIDDPQLHARDACARLDRVVCRRHAEHVANG